MRLRLSVPSTRVYAMKPPPPSASRRRTPLSVPSTRVYAMKQVVENRGILEDGTAFSTLDSGLRDETRTRGEYRMSPSPFSTLDSGLRDETCLRSSRSCAVLSSFSTLDSGLRDETFRWLFPLPPCVVLSVPSTRVYAMKQYGISWDRARRYAFSTLDSGLRDETFSYRRDGVSTHPTFQYPRLGSTR